MRNDEKEPLLSYNVTSYVCRLPPHPFPRLCTQMERCILGIVHSYLSVAMSFSSYQMQNLLRCAPLEPDEGWCSCSADVLFIVTYYDCIILPFLQLATLLLLSLKILHSPLVVVPPRMFMEVLPILRGETRHILKLDEK